MVAKETLEKFGLSPEEVTEFFRLHERKQYSALERLLRKCRQSLLDGIHRDEKLISDLDYLLYEIRNGKTEEG